MSEQATQPGSDADALAEIVARVRQRLPEAPAEQIDREVSTAFHQFDGQPIRDFIPLLVERVVVERLGTSRAASTVS